MRVKLSGAKVLVTGATSGIGRSLVEELNREGARVIVVARDPAKLERLAERYPLAGVYQCDLGDPVALAKLGDDLLLRHPDLHVLINNAAVQQNLPFDSQESTPEGIAYELNTNLLAPVLLCRKLLPLLKRQPEAAILNVTSGLALVPKQSSAVYCGSKGGLRIFTQALRLQLEGSSVRVIEALPPVVDTPMTEGRGRDKVSPDSVAQEMVRALRGRERELYLGKVRLLHWLSRIAPGVARRIMRRLG